MQLTNLSAVADLKFKCWRQLNAILFLATVRCQRFLTKEKSPRKHPKLADIAHDMYCYMYWNVLVALNDMSKWMLA